MTRSRAVGAAVLLLLAVSMGWLVWWLTQAPPAAGLRLLAVNFSELPGWSTSDPRAALAAFRRSCATLRVQSPQQAMSGGYAGTVGDWRDVCDGVPAAPSAGGAKAWLARNFRAFAVSEGNRTDGLFTGYYEPALNGSTNRHGRYRYPVYGTPSDLVEVDLGQFRDALAGERIAGRIEGHRLVPYATRAQIDSDGLRTAPVLFYCDDPVAVFFLHIQGSGRVNLDDGRSMRVAYAAQNGQVYTPIGRALIARGAIAREHMSMQAIADWLRANPLEARKVMEEDRSYVFFREEPIGNPTLGSDGAEGVPLTPEASLAVDPRIHALGVPMYVAATAPSDDPAEPEQPFDRVMVAQDIGGAIRGAVRGDVFFGFGERAESLAGRMKSKGRLYVFLPRHLAERRAARAS